LAANVRTRRLSRGTPDKPQGDPGQKASQGQDKTENQGVGQRVGPVVFVAEKHRYVLGGRARALWHSSIAGCSSTGAADAAVTIIIRVVYQVLVKFTAYRRLHHGESRTTVQGHYHAFIYVMTGTDVVGDTVEAADEILGSDNKACEKVVDADKDAAQDNRRCRRLNQTYEQLTHVTVNGKVEREKALGMTTNNDDP
jgi:hypothetical protein